MVPVKYLPYHIISFYIIYLVLGAAVFYSIESPLEKDLRRDLASKREKFLAKYPCLSEHELDTFMMEVLHASQQGVAPAIRNVSNIPNWGYGGSFFFAGALITTIGRLKLLFLTINMVNTMPVLYRAGMPCMVRV